MPTSPAKLDASFATPSGFFSCSFSGSSEVLSAVTSKTEVSFTASGTADTGIDSLGIPSSSLGRASISCSNLSPSKITGLVCSAIYLIFLCAF